MLRASWIALALAAACGDGPTPRPAPLGVDAGGHEVDDAGDGRDPRDPLPDAGRPPYPFRDAGRPPYPTGDAAASDLDAGADGAVPVTSTCNDCPDDTCCAPCPCPEPLVLCIRYSPGIECPGPIRCGECPR